MLTPQQNIPGHGNGLPAMCSALAVRLREYFTAAMPITSYALLGVIWLAIMLAFLRHMIPRIMGILHRVPLANTPPCDAVQCDFSVFWPAGLLARHGRFQDLYNPEAFSVFRMHVLFAGEARMDWLYPPPSLLPVMLVAHLPIGPAFIVWTLALAFLGVSLLRWAGLSWLVIIAATLSPAALWDFEMGQWEFFCGAVLAAGLLLQGRAGMRGGMLLSFMILKPQIAVAAPVGLLAGGRWGTIRGGIIGLAALLGLTTFVLGAPVWSAWLAPGIPNAAEALNQNHARGMEESISVFWMWRNLDAPVRLAELAQVVAAVCAAVVTWTAWRQSRLSDRERVALTIFCGLLFTPYAYTSDMVAYEIALALLAESRRWRIDLLDVSFWLWPAISPALYIWKGWLLTPVIVLLAIARTGQRAWSRSTGYVPQKAERGEV